MEHTVSRQDNLLSIEHGVIIVHLKYDNHVVAICYFNGCVIREGNYLWVKDQIDRMKCKIIKEM